jgi:hypothetical protein
MSTLMMGSLALALLLLFAAPWIAKLLIRGRDPGGLTRILQAAGLVLLVISLLAWPRSPESTAFPPPPEGPPGAGH